MWFIFFNPSKNPKPPTANRSATMEAEKYSEYFNKCPVFTVPGRTYPGTNNRSLSLTHTNRSLSLTHTHTHTHTRSSPSPAAPTPVPIQP